MRGSSLIMCTMLGAVALMLATTVVLEHGVQSLLLGEHELPVQLERRTPPNCVEKYIIWFQRLIYVPRDECRLYLAESTIPRTGMGVFTTVDLQAQDQVASELVIPITFEAGTPLWRMWQHYVWHYTRPGIDVSEEQAAFIPGMGSTVNSNHWDLTNLYAVGKAQYDTSNLHRTADVGAGGFTPYVKSGSNVFTDVSAGSELLSFYGDSFFHSQPIEESAFHQADQMLVDFDKFVNDHADLNTELTEAMWKDLIQEFPISEPQEGFMGVQALPQRTWSELFADKSLQGSSSWSRDVRRHEHRQPVDWLQKHGFCMDYIEERRSTIPQAGRGAFATRFIPKGTRIALSPLIHIADKKVNDWCHQDVKKELVRNYSFGNPQTSLLLTPSGAGVGLINHSSRDTNVKLQWPTESLPSHDPEFLSRPVTALSGETMSSLSLEYVATRNIYPHEELFLDYGEEWEMAWDRHVRRWRPQTEWFVHPTQMNRHEAIRTLAELEYNPYPPNLYLLCETTFVTNNQGINLHLPDDDAEWMPCEVTSRSGYVYSVRLESGVEIHQVSHNGITFHTHAGMGDWALPKAFRHEIMLPNDLIPEAWKDKKSQPCT